MLSIFNGVPQSEVSRTEYESGIGLLDFLSAKAGAFKSNGEARRMIKDNAVSVNKSKITEDFVIDEKCLINDKYVLVQKGKKNYFLVKVV